MYLKDKAQALGVLVIHNGTTGSNAAATELSGDIAEPLTVRNASVELQGTLTLGTMDVGGSVVRHEGAVTLGELALSGQSTWINNGTLTIHDGYTVQNSTWINNGNFHPPTTDLVVDGYTYVINNTQTWATVQVINGGRIVHDLASGTNVNRMVLNAESVTIDETSMIDVSGKGCVDSGLGNYVGGSHGGRGGDYRTNPSRPCFGDFREPADYGGGSMGSCGGGIVKIVAGTLRVDGAIVADGVMTDASAGGSAGGSIWLDVGRLEGDGQIRANGASTDWTSGGGGGRVAIYYDEIVDFDLAGQAWAQGGAHGWGENVEHGGAGTIYLENRRGPAIILSSVPAGPINTPVDTVEIHFLSSIDPSTFTVDDVVLTGPSGPIVPDNVVPSNKLCYLVNLSAPLTEEGRYELTIGPDIRTLNGVAMDQNRNGISDEPDGDVYRDSFVIDCEAPAAPEITTHPLAPVTNYLRAVLATLQGTREDQLSVWVQGVLRIAEGGGAWSCSVELTQGVNTVFVHARDQAGNCSTTNEVLFLVDTVAPAVTGVSPEHQTRTNVPPGTIRLDYTEITSGLDVSRSAIDVSRAGLSIPGQWAVASDSLTFTPAGALLDGLHQVSAVLVDAMGNTGVYSSVFMVDSITPPPPVVQPIVSPTTIRQQTFSGAKESDTAIYRNGQQVVGHTSSTNWSFSQSLANGLNTFAFTARDQAGNESDPVVAMIVYDDLAPGPVTVTADGDRDGLSVALNWSGYDEVVTGDDISHYTVYQSGAAFTNLGQAVAIGTQTRHQKSYIVTNLQRSTTYHFAVVARDLAGQFIPAVTSVSATTVDVTPPSNPSGLRFDCFATNLIARWTPPANADLAGQRVYFNGALTAVELPASATEYDAGGGLDSATAYPVRVTAYDQDDNESAGANATGITWLSNPTDVTVTPYSGLADLTWSASTPTNYVKHYAIYVHTSAFASVAGMTAQVTRTTTWGSVAGLKNKRTYHFGVAAVNRSGGMDPAIISWPATPRADTEGPVLSHLRFDSTPLASSLVIRRPGTFWVEASDRAGVSRVKFWVNGALLVSTANGTTNCSAFWNAARTTNDGLHELEIRAYDSLNNETVLSTNVNVTLAVPTAPTITAPANRMFLNRTQVAVTGTGAAYADSVVLYVNGTAETGRVVVLSSGAFQGTATLAEGTNVLRAAAVNRAGEGALSAPVTVTVDLSVPDAPRFPQATARADGEVELSWMEGANVRGYRLYGASVPFENQDASLRLNAMDWLGTNYRDLPATDGNWYYRISAVNAAGTEGPLSAIVSAVSDRVPPRVVEADYATTGVYDPSSGTFGRGRVTVTLKLDEELLAAPFFSLNVPGALPISVAMTRSETNVLIWRGAFDVTASTPGGTAHAVFSGRDKAGNRGTEIEAGIAIEIDTAGPVMRDLQVSPAAPIRNDSASPLSVEVVAVFDAEDTPVGGPRLMWRLTESSPEWAELSMEQVTSSSWAGTVVLSASAGQNPENLEFSYEGQDALGNTGGDIEGAGWFQVYQGDLPPLEAPWGVTGTALPDGWVRLEWAGVDEAADYAVFMGPSSEALSFVEQTGGTQEWSARMGDASNWYGVASVRQAGELSSTSAVSSVRLVTDAQAPAAPENIQITLYGNGMYVTWDAVAETNVRYRLYRDSSPIASVEGLSALVTNIPRPEALDRNPAQGPLYYAVTATDTAGNESASSANAHTNLSLLPVNSLKIRLPEGGFPVLSWTHAAPSGIAGYNLYLGDGDDNRLVAELTSAQATNWMDTGYMGDVRQYTVRARDARGQESVPRSVLLPRLALRAPADATLRRGMMNRLVFTADNLMDTALTNVQARVAAGGHLHQTEPFDVAPGETPVAVVVGGYSNLPPMATLTNTLALTSQQGEVEITGVSSHEVVNDYLVARIMNGELNRGGTTEICFEIHNTSEEPAEIVLASGMGSQPSPEIRVKLLTIDGMVLSTASPKQMTGEKVVTLASKVSVARVPAGESFTSEPFALIVPTNAPTRARLQLEVDRLHYHHGEIDQVSMDGIIVTRDISLSETIYYAEATNITPAASVGATNILIQGRAVNRATGDPQQNAPVRVTVSRQGFERDYAVISDGLGQWSLNFAPLPDEAGLFKVWATHPNIAVSPEQGTFVIQQIGLYPTAFNLTMPYHAAYTGAVTLTTASGTDVTNLRLIGRPEDQEGGVWPAGIAFEALNSVGSLGGGQSATLRFVIGCDETAASNSTAILRVVSEDNAEEGWGTLRLDLRLREPAAALRWEPSWRELGVQAGNDLETELVLINAGLAPAEDLSFEILMTNRTPAPDWVRFCMSTQANDLEAGASRTAGLRIAPPESVEEKVWPFLLRAGTPRQGGADAPLYVRVDNSGRGSILFKVMDIYAGTHNVAGGLIEGVAGAQIQLQRETGMSYQTNVVTDSVGEAWVEQLPEGSYLYRISTSAHEPLAGRLWVHTGVATPVEVMLNNRLVAVEWSVREITIEDRYEIVLHTVFQTDVPAAVLVMEPAGITIPRGMEAGQVINGELRIINHGLIRAVDVTFPQVVNLRRHRMELLAPVPETIEAKQVVRIPYRIVCLVSRSGTEQGGGGSDDQCLVSSGCGLRYGTECINGQYMTCAFSFSLYEPEPCPPASKPGSVVAQVSGTSHGAGYSGGGGGSLRSISIEAPCVDDPCKDDPAPECCRLRNRYKVRSAVQTSIGDYQDERLDLVVKTVGGHVGIGRVYREGRWHWAEVQSQLYFMDSTNRPSAHTNDSAVIHFVYNDQGRPTGILDHFSNQVVWIEYETAGSVPRVASVRDYENRTVEYRYDHLGLLTNVVDVLGREETYAYDPKERLIAKTMPGEEPVTLEYNSYGGIARVGDTQFEYSFNEAARVYYATITTADGRIKETWTDESGRVFRHALNGVIVYDRDSEAASRPEYPKAMTNELGRIERVEFLNGTYRQYEYNGPEFGLTKIVDEHGKATQFEYDPEGRLLRTIIAVGTEREQRTDYLYDGLGQCIQKTVSGAGIPSDMVWRWTYDDKGNVLAESDPSGLVISNLGYDVMGNLLHTVDSHGAETRYTYDELGRRTSETDAFGRVSSNRYDEAGRRIWSRDLDGLETVWTYDEHGDLVAVEDPVEGMTRMEYDEAGRIVREIHADGTEIPYEYDSLGRVIPRMEPGVLTETDEEGRLIKAVHEDGAEYHYEYGENGLLARVLGPEDETRYFYDPIGNLIERVDRLGHVTRTNRWEYDLFNQLTREEDPEGRVWQYEYNAYGEMVRATDPLGHDLTYSFTPFGRPSGFGDQAGKSVAFEYDFAAPHVLETRPDGAFIKRQYGPTGLLLTEEHASGRRMRLQGLRGLMTNILYTADGQPDLSVDMAYDYDGQLTNARMQGMTATLEYGEHGQQASRTFDFGHFSKTYEVGLDSLGRVTSLTYPEGDTVAYTYDAENRPASITGGGEGVVAFQREPRAAGHSILWPGGVRQMIRQDAWGRITNNVVVDMADTILMERRYDYYKDDRLKTLSTGSEEREYAYDGLGRLISATSSVPGGLQEAYAYDPAWNRRVPGEMQTTNWNRLVSWPGGSYEYDEDGRVTRRTTGTSDLRFDYDAAGRLEYVWDAASNRVARYLYDAGGLRIGKMTASATNWYVYGPWGLLAEYDDAGTLLREYGYSPDSSWMTPLWVQENGERYYYIVDPFHGPEMLLRDNGAVAWRGVPEAYGRLHVLEGDGQPLRVSGQYYDEETGLHYNTRRYYDPETGRYLTPDPAGYVDGANLYLFALGDPVNSKDFMGLYCEDFKFNWDTCTVETFCDQMREALEYAELAGMLYSTVPDSYKGSYSRVYSWNILGFQAALFRNDCGHCFLTYSGTHMWFGLPSPLDIVGGWTGGGLPFWQTEQAKRIARYARRNCKSGSIAGHSLGGGLAQVGTSVLGWPTVTFSSMGVNKWDALWLRGKQDCVKNYFVDGEILTHANDSSILSPVIPGTLGPVIQLPKPSDQSGRTSRHGLDSVTTSLEIVIELECGGSRQPEAECRAK